MKKKGVRIQYLFCVKETQADVYQIMEGDKKKGWGSFIASSRQWNFNSILLDVIFFIAIQVLCISSNTIKVQDPINTIN